MIYVKLKDLITALGVQNGQLNGVLPRIVNDRHVPGATRLKLKPMWRELYQRFSDYEDERNRLLLEYAKPDPNDPEAILYNPNNPREPDWKTVEAKLEFNAAHKKMLESVIKIEGERIKYPGDFEPRKATADPSLEDLFATAEQIMLDFIIDDGLPASLEEQLLADAVKASAEASEEAMSPHVAETPLVEEATA